MADPCSDSIPYGSQGPRRLHRQSENEGARKPEDIEIALARRFSPPRREHRWKPAGEVTCHKQQPRAPLELLGRAAHKSLQVAAGRRLPLITIPFFTIGIRRSRTVTNCRQLRVSNQSFVCKRAETDQPTSDGPFADFEAHHGHSVAPLRSPAGRIVLGGWNRSTVKPVPRHDSAVALDSFCRQPLGEKAAAPQSAPVTL